MEFFFERFTFLVWKFLSFNLSIILKLLVLETTFVFTFATNLNSKLISNRFIQILHQVFLKSVFKFVKNGDLILLGCISLFSSYPWVGIHCIRFILTLGISLIIGHNLLRIFFFLFNHINFVIVYEVTWVHDDLFRDLDIRFQPVRSLCNELCHGFC